jgi:hypothetical protein
MPSFRHLLPALALCCALPLAAQVTFTTQTYTAPSGTSQGHTIAADIDLDGNPISLLPTLQIANS